MRTPTESSTVPQGFQRPDAEGYERSDMTVKWVFACVAAFFISGIAIHFIIAGELFHLGKQSSPTDQWARSGNTRPAREPVKNFPRLQISPPADLQAFLAREEAELHSYGWINKTAGIARIPIERAVQILGEKRLGTGTNGIRTSDSGLQLQQKRPLSRERENGGAQ
jgi:hypothetical protein